MCVFIAHVQYIVTRFYRKIKLIKIQCAEIVEHVQQNAQPVHVKPKMCNVKPSCATKIYDSLAPKPLSQFFLKPSESWVLPVYLY